MELFKTKFVVHHDKPLILNVRKQYFDEIKSGKKREEYRLFNDYWTKRLYAQGYVKWFPEVHIKLGYPEKGNIDRTLIFPFLGWQKKRISHEHFGTDIVTVFAIKLHKYEKKKLQKPEGS